MLANQGIIETAVILPPLFILFARLAFRQLRKARPQAIFGVKCRDKL
jgi:hypothetical protein